MPMTDAISYKLPSNEPITEEEVNRQDACGTTSLMRATLDGNLTAIKYLISLGADARKVDEKGWSSFMTACVLGRLGTLIECFFLP